MYLAIGITSKSRVFLLTDRCSLPKSKRSVVIVKTGVFVKMMRIELSTLSRWFSTYEQFRKVLNSLLTNKYTHALLINLL